MNNNDYGIITVLSSYNGELLIDVAEMDYISAVIRGL